MIKKYIGCSGYYYNHWKDIFYPGGLAKIKWLPFYAQHFNTVEINSSFYHMPLDSSLNNWYKITPPGFNFTLKGNRFITHMKKLNVDQELTELVYVFQQKAYLLKDKLGCILWQLPGSFRADVKKLEEFCKLLDASIPHVFEFRHSSWFTPEILEILKIHNASLCILSAPGNLPEMVETTSNIAYIRFHGINGWYNDNYSNEQLDTWAQKIKNLKVDQLYAYFNNDFNGFAVHNGLYFSQQMELIYEP